MWRRLLIDLDLLDKDSVGGLASWNMGMEGGNGWVDGLIWGWTPAFSL